MKTIESVFRLTNPMWARLPVLSCVVVAIGILVLAPRAATPQAGKPTTPATEVVKKNQQIFMRVKPIKLIPEDSHAEVQLSIFVNGAEFRHPSVAGVEWMKTGPSMSDKIIELPKADRYDVRFEMRVRRGGLYSGASSQMQASQQVTPVRQLPYSEAYRLYPVEHKTRGASVAGVVTYEIYAQ